MDSISNRHRDAVTSAGHCLRASDLRIGWVFLRDLDPRAVVCVLPKPWRPHPAPPVATLLEGKEVDGTKPWYCFQGDVLWSGSEQAPAGVLEKLIEYSRKEVSEAEKRRVKKEAQARDEDQGDADDQDDRAQARRLFQAAPFRATEQGVGRSTKSPNYLQALIRLLDRARPAEWEDALRFRPDPLFRESVAARYVHVLAKAAQHMRRGYLERRDWLGTPRGRIVAASAGRSDESGEPFVVCDYNEFSTDTPLHRVLVSALRLAAGIVSDQDQPGEELLRTAMQLRYQLQDVAFFPPAVARRIAMGLRLTPGQRGRWAAPLRLALAVLHTWAPTGADEDDPDPTPDLTIPSASLWERIISESLKTQKNAFLYERDETQLEEDDDADDEGGNDLWAPLYKDDRRIKPPWSFVGARRFRADIIVEVAEENAKRAVILDAKYTRPKSDRKNRPVVPVAHSRQLFAYGMLWQKPESVDKIDVGLVYLAAGGVTKATLLAARKDGTQPEFGPVPFSGPTTLNRSPACYVCEMPFPNFDSCLNETDLGTYLMGRGSELFTCIAPAREPA